MAENKMEMDPEVLRTTARKVETSAGDVRKELKRFTSVIEGLSSTWSSEVKDRFLQNYQKDRAALLEMAVSVTLFAFDKGEEISTHDSTGDAMVQVLEGKGKFTVGGKEHFCCAGDVLIMPAKVPHAVYAEESFKMLLTVVFPTEQE